MEEGGEADRAGWQRDADFREIARRARNKSSKNGRNIDLGSFALLDLFGLFSFFNRLAVFFEIEFSLRLSLIIVIAIIGALWFYFPLEKHDIYIPFFGNIFLGWLFIPFFILVMLAIFSGSVIDGIDGLSGGVMAAIFGAYAGIAFFQNQIDLAAFSAVLVGAIAAFLWFNIPPARFYMGETGILGLTTSLAVIAFLTDAVSVLPLIALPLVLDSASVINQLTSKKFFGKKV